MGSRERCNTIQHNAIQFIILQSYQILDIRLPTWHSLFDHVTLYISGLCPFLVARREVRFVSVASLFAEAKIWNGSQV
jgi:hypothetical protein